MADFLLELRSEEIPARMQAGARAELEKLFRREMEAAGVTVGDLTVWSTPRRLALIARDLPTETKAVREEAKGPPVGAPDRAVDGFCRKNGVTRDQLEERDVKGRATWFAVIEKAGQAVTELLAAAIPVIIRDFSWPKSMRWGDASISSESTRWVRPLSGIVALLDGEVVPCVTDGLASGRETVGHRFHAPPGATLTKQTAGVMGTKIGGLKTMVVSPEGTISINDVDDYEWKLAMAKVMVNHSIREDEIRYAAKSAAKSSGLTLVEDEGLVVENAGLTEWPVPLLGRFDEAYLDVPPEVIQLTARVNQKYFVCENAEGKLANAFICTANIEALDPAVVVDGNRKVLAARLSDARFFWELDQKKTLAEHAEGLQRITFHEKLGTVADKVDRVAKLARWLVEEGIVTDTPLPLAGGAGGGSGSDQASPTPNPSREREGNLADLAEQAARLCKADLVTEMVGEFPELQGLMGGYYAEKEGLPVEVSEAIRDHYKPVGQGDDVPNAPVTVAVSLADKLDTLVGFFGEELLPTGSKDPFALRRAAIGSLELALTNGLRISLKKFIGQGVKWHGVMLMARASLKEPRLLELVEEVQSHGNWQSIPDRMDSITSYAKKIGLEVRSDFDDLAIEEMAHSYEILGRGKSTSDNLIDFFADRLKVQQREAGVRHDLIDAVFALGGEDDLVRLLARVHALQSFIETENGANLLAGYKRAANILKKEGWDKGSGTPDQVRGDDKIDGLGEEDPLALAGKPEFDATMSAAEDADTGTALSYTPEKAEKALIDALDAAAPKAAKAVSEERFEDAMAALATLRAPIDAFFEDVTVNDEDPQKREARLDLLARFTRAVGNVADFSKIEG